MREIKFRYRIKQKYIGHTEIIVRYYTLDDIANYGKLHAGETLISRDEYTGLKDKNGKEVYEGDIIVDNGNITKPLYEIRFYDYGFRLKGNTNLNGYTLHSTGKRIEVISDIHQNPELLQEAK